MKEYARAPELLRESISDMTTDQLDAAPVPGKWSTREVICHIADFELVYADRMKRVIAEDEPTFYGGDPDVFAAELAYKERRVDEELQLIESVRAQISRILRSLDPKDFYRIGIHSSDGMVSLEVLLEQITNHIPHHIGFINDKRTALDL